MVKKKSNLIEIITLVLTMISLIISLISLGSAKEANLISNSSYLLSSQNLEPKIDFDVDNVGINIINYNNDLFKINYLEVLQVDTFSTSNGWIGLPAMAIKSNIYPSDEDKVYFKFENAHIKSAFDVEEHSVASKEILEKYSSSIPSSNSRYFLIAVGYIDEVDNFRKVYYKYYHMHGLGYFKEKISEEKIMDLVKLLDIPETY